MNKGMTEKFNELHSFQLAMQSKPTVAIRKMHQAMIPYGLPFVLPVRRTVELRSPKIGGHVFFIEKGFFSLHHRRNEFDIVYSFSPSLVGLVDVYSYFYNIKNSPVHAIRAETQCSGYKIPAGIFAQKVEELNLWNYVFEIMAHRLMVLSARENEFIGVNAYAMIRTMLMELWLYPEEARKTINIEQFIRHRTRLSRSMVMRVIAVLRSGGYIEVHHGKLIKMNPLPKGY